ncbi:hypothetical protein B0H16DRAFT_1571486, partial [Mycena metata]
MPPYTRVSERIQGTMPPRKLGTRLPSNPRNVSASDIDVSHNYISLESTIQSLRDGTVVRPRSSSQHKPTAPTLFDAAAAEYDAALLKRQAKQTPRLGQNPPDISMLLGLTTRKAQPEPLTPAKLALLGILNASPPTAGHRDITPEGVAVVKQASASAELPGPSASQFSQLFPDGFKMWGAGEPPSPALADAIWGAMGKAGSGNAQGSVERHDTAHPASVSQRELAVGPARSGADIEASKAGAQFPARPPVFTRPPVNEQTKVSPRRDNHDVEARSPGIPRCVKPSEAVGEDIKRGILGEIMNRQYIRRRDSS